MLGAGAATATRRSTSTSGWKPHRTLWSDTARTAHGPDGGCRAARKATAVEHEHPRFARGGREHPKRTPRGALLPVRLFRALFDATAGSLAGLEAAGVVRPAADPAVRAAFLLVNDLAVILLREQVQAVLGVDPLGPTGLGRWSQTLMDTYSRGIFALGPEEEQP
ncbi:hypothetical protein [Rhodococcus opacus]|uniref:hypothetical protein n=1 Tax=Rhodococcus opacus TaxID=37919 RepID=UPI0022649092|nr:hypothetical protein [Rhodococcus opacus]